MDYTVYDFVITQHPRADESTATCRHCGERHAVGNPNGDAVWQRVQHDSNCRLMKAANEAAESKR